MRMTVNDAERDVVQAARKLKQLQHKRHTIMTKVEAVDREIEAAKETLRGFVPEDRSLLMAR
jgi:hypothetical protein